MAMTEKQSVPFDDPIRKALDALPDAPPPGSTFDAGRLWEQLRPELAQLPPSEPVQPQRRLFAGRWWFAAASLVGLLSWLLWFQLHEPKTTPGLSHNSKPASKPSVQQPELASITVAKPKSLGKRSVPKSPATFHKSGQSQEVNALVSQATSGQITPETAPTEPASQQPAPSPAEAMADVPDSPTIAEVQASKTVSASKNRWRVVHQNELPALDEAYQVHYRSAQYGRLGTGSQAGQPENLPLFSIPLSRKPIQ